MSDSPASPSAARLPRRRALVALLAGAGVIVLPSCGGGGGGVAGVDTGGTGSFSTGRISGFGSVIVNGVRYEDNAARIADDDDPAKVLGTDDLKLGMVVRVEAGPVTPGTATTLPRATASTIVVESQIKGPVESKTAPDTLVVFGQAVRVSAATVFEGTTFAGIAVGDVLEVSGFAGANGVTTASRIEDEGTTSEFKVRGTIAQLDATARTFRIGTAVFHYGAAGVRLPTAPLANGLFVRVRTRTTANAAGQWVVTRIDLRREVEDRDEAKLEGILLRNGTQLQVNGVTIDTSGLPAGTSIPVNQRVEVEGEIVDGVLVARELHPEDEDDEAEVDVRGTASAVNTSAQTFVVRGLTFHYHAGTRFDDGTVAADLRNGAELRVRGLLPSGGSGNIEASRIDFRP